MSGAKLKSIGIFIVIMLFLGTLVVGGVRLVKERNVAYAGSNAAPVQATAGHEAKSPLSQPQPKSSQATPKPVPEEKSSSAGVVAESRDKPLSPAPVAASNVPATGPSLLDASLTSLFVMVAAYCGVNFFKARARFRRVSL